MKAALLLGMAFGVASPACADVLEIGAKGTVVVRAADRGSTTRIANADSGGVIEDAPDVPAAAITSIDAPIAPAAYQLSLAAAADKAHVSPTLLAALVWQESRWHAAAVSPKGARGLTQLMPGTARALAVDPADVAANLAGGARYLRTMIDRFDGNLEHALAAYNAGPGRVLRARGVPAIAETRAYVSSILDRVGKTGNSIGGVKP